jgi:hypothetical protein
MEFTQDARDAISLSLSTMNRATKEAFALAISAMYDTMSAAAEQHYPALLITGGNSSERHKY